MKKCLIYGNCQTAYIKKCLLENPEFSKIYEQVFTKKVHRIQPHEIPELEAMISEIDLFIHQTVSDNYRNMPSLGTAYLKSRLKPDCKVISFPVAYFTGYHPEMIYLKPLNSQPIKEDIYNYHDFNILSGFYEGKSIEDIVNEIFHESFYSIAYVKNNLEFTLGELAKREVNLDVKLSQFIKDNYQYLNLFNTINHPHHPIIAYFVNRILEILGLGTQYTKSEIIKNQYSLEYNNYFPVYPSVQKILDIQFQNKLAYKFQNINYSVYDAIKKLYKFYDNNQELVEFNIENKWERFNRKNSKFSSIKRAKSDVDLTSKETVHKRELDSTLHLSNLIEQLSDLSDRLIKQKQFSQAIIITKSLVELTPKNIKNWQKLARLYELNQDWESGISCHQHILKLSPQHSNTYINLGRLYQKQNCFEQAVNYYQQGIKLNSQQPSWVYRFLGNCLQELGSLEDAIAQYNQALSLPNSPPIIYIELGNALKGQNRNLEAHQAYQKAIDLNSQLSALIKS